MPQSLALVARRHAVAGACALAALLAGPGVVRAEDANNPIYEAPSKSRSNNARPDGGSASANGDHAADAVTLSTSPSLAETVPSDTRDQLPLFIWGDQISGTPNLDTRIKGNAEVRRGDTVLRADELDYYQPDDRARATGNVRLNHGGNIYESQSSEIKLGSFEGYSSDVHYRMLETGAYGDAARVDYVDRDRSVVVNGSYTTCQRSDSDPNWSPDWILRADRITFDREADEGIAENASLTFLGLTTPAFPSLSFPLSDKRKTGLLTPSFGLDTQSGFEYIQPWYWNIAPNRDATLYVHTMTKRGVSGGGEFRYLEPSMVGSVSVDGMHYDRLRGEQRWGFSAKHFQQLPNVLPGNLVMDWNFNRVSDNNYWRDFPHSSPGLIQRLLPNEGGLGWGYGEYFSSSLRGQKWQTLQEDDSFILPPYNRLPQWDNKFNRPNWGGFDVEAQAQYTHFQLDRNYANRMTLEQPDAQRSVVNASIARPFLTPGAFITPKVLFHGSNYQFSRDLNQASGWRQGQGSANINVPTVSLDSGLIFERDTNLLGRSLQQTLEPRAFYVYTPFRDQSTLPLYDTSYNDFNFASIYTENAFSGQDRIADNNLLTLGLTSRLIDANTGAEALSLGVAQRVRFEDQKVLLQPQIDKSNPNRYVLDTSPNEKKGADDVLVGGNINWTSQWSANALWQYSYKKSTSQRSIFGARYTPGPYKSISAAYRLQRALEYIEQRDVSELIDLGWQWPLSDLWSGGGRDPMRKNSAVSRKLYTVGRLHYSLQDKRLVDTVVGFEYGGCCWIGRVVVERLQNSLQTSNTRLLFQLEFNGFSRLNLGSDPISSLQQNIPNYRPLRFEQSSPSRFSTYD